MFETLPVCAFSRATLIECGSKNKTGDMGQLNIPIREFPAIPGP